MTKHFAQWLDRNHCVSSLLYLFRKDSSSIKLHQVDVTTAFLNGTLEEEVFIKQPEGFETKGNEQYVCKLKKGLPRCWTTALDTKLKEMEFTQSQNDPCIYYNHVSITRT